MCKLKGEPETGRLETMHNAARGLAPTTPGVEGRPTAGRQPAHGLLPLGPLRAAADLAVDTEAAEKAALAAEWLSPASSGSLEVRAPSRLAGP